VQTALALWRVREADTCQLAHGRSLSLSKGRRFDKLSNRRTASQSAVSLRIFLRPLVAFAFGGRDAVYFVTRAEVEECVNCAGDLACALRRNR
jgi:hypothetical protein